MYKVSKKYVIQDKDGEDFIVPVDYANTGITMKNTIWSNGLHQFVQLKHNLQLTSESLTTSFISNLGYINKYKNIFGLTGTLGSQAEQELLSAIYNIDYAKISTYKEKKFNELDGLVVDEENWANIIVLDALAQTDEGRAVLIVCETIKDTVAVKEKLEILINNGKANNVELRSFANEDDASVTKKTLEPGNIVLSTNIAGRGTDFKTSKQVEEAGGLYVCVGFLPCNKRVEDQAFGRTSRQGNNGSAKLIIRESEVENYEMSNFNTIKYDRDRKEANRIENIKQTKIGELSFQDSLFAEFTSLYRSIKDNSEETKAEFILSDLKRYGRFGLKNKSLIQS